MNLEINEVKISRLALISLVLSLLFWLPFIASLLAVLIGIVALLKIKNSKGYLLGQKMALSGVLIGFLGMLLWGGIVLGNAVFIAKPGEVVAIYNKGNLDRVVRSGIHFKIPFYEVVSTIPKDTKHLHSTGFERYLGKTMTTLKVDVSYSWEVCEPELFAKNVGGYERAQLMNSRYNRIIKDYMRKHLSDVDFKKTSVVDLLKHDMTSSFVFSMYTSLNSEYRLVFGTCLTKVNPDKTRGYFEFEVVDPIVENNKSNKSKQKGLARSDIVNDICTKNGYVLHD